MELLCLAGAALSLVATLLESFRDSLVFFCLWVLYLSLYQVSLYLSDSDPAPPPPLTSDWLVVLPGGAGLSLLPVVSVWNQTTPSHSAFPLKM